MTGKGEMGDDLKLTNLNKIFWPDEVYTKGDLINYYEKVSSYILPHLKDRPESLHRFPNGLKDKGFYQKNVSDLNIDWAKTVKIKHENEEVEYFLCQDKKSLLYLINLGCIELNPWLSRIGSLDKPDFLVIDLDPYEIEFDAVIETTQTVKKVLDELTIEGYPKTSGATGMHIYIPLGAKYTYDQVKQFGKIIAILTHEKLPGITSIERNPSKRRGRVYIDYLQNNKGQTVASAYSVRPVPGAAVSAPLEWNEVKKGLSPRDFNIKTILPRLKKKGDIFRGVLHEKIDLEKIVKDMDL